MSNYTLEYYQTPTGKEPVEEFLQSLDQKMHAKLVVAMKALEKGGPTLREPYSKHLADGIFELRGKQGSNHTRVLYFFYIDKHILMTHGFVKKTQKTPRREIMRAKKYRKDYLQRKEK